MSPRQKTHFRESDMMVDNSKQNSFEIIKIIAHI